QNVSDDQQSRGRGKGRGRGRNVGGDARNGVGGFIRADQYRRQGIGVKIRQKKPGAIFANRDRIVKSIGNRTGGRASESNIIKEIDVVRESLTIHVHSITGQDKIGGERAAGQRQRRVHCIGQSFSVGDHCEVGAPCDSTEQGDDLLRVERNSLGGPVVSLHL